MRRARDTNKNKRLFLPEQEGSLEVCRLLWPLVWFLYRFGFGTHLTLHSPAATVRKGLARV